MERDRHVVDVSVGALSNHYESLSIEVSKLTSADEIILCIAEKLRLANISNYELAEVVSNPAGQECKERRLMSNEKPAALQLLWPQCARQNGEKYQCKFYLREKLTDSFWSDNLVTDPQIIKDYFYKFLYQPKDKEYPDLCLLPNLNEGSLLENLKARFDSGHIYTYVGSILIAVNPFKFYPIYNPKYVKLYQNKRLGELPPHIFAIADSAYHTMLKERKNQCVVISGESGSGKTESTNFLLHHLTALSQKGSHGSGVEQTILSAGPVLEAFGNAKTAHNNNSSRFGKFIQVNYKENGLVHGAVVQKYLLEKSRICSQSLNERSYHVFYYLLSGATDAEKKEMHLLDPKEYKYLNQSKCYHIDGVDESYEYKRLKQSMEMVGFSYETQKKLFSVLSAVLLLGNIEYQQKKTAYHHDESVLVKNAELLNVISKLLKVKEDTLASALTTKKARTGGEILVINYRLAEAMAARDTLAKCLYGALFDWIVLQVNHALLSKKDLCKESAGFSIGVLDIFGFEDFGNCNSFEQFCINYANERLQNYFNQHVFKYEQEEYQRESIKWSNITFIDNSTCLSMIEARPTGLLCILDDQCALPSATNETLLQKFHSVHKDSEYYAAPQKKEFSFTIRHYAGQVKYQINEFREKNLDLMRGDIVNVLKNSSQSFVRELVSSDPVAGFRWAILRAFFQAHFAFIQAGKRHHQANGGSQRGYRKSITPKIHSMHSDILKKSKSSKPKRNSRYVVKNLQTVKVLAGKSSQCCVMPAISTSSNSNTGRGTRKQPHTVTAQFQSSLLSLLVTLNRATPFFIRCIKSNAHKRAEVFDDEIIQRQLRYTGMLETVRIRQAGFSVRMTFETFTQHYRILLPKGLQSTPHDIKMFLLSVNLNRDNYQVGISKIFMRESEKLKLDYRLHQAILIRIVTIQRWFRCVSQRRHFMRLRDAVVKIQAQVRCFLAQRLLYTLRMQHCAAIFIQKIWRGYRIRKWYQGMRSSLQTFQAHARGYLVRVRVKGMSEKYRMTPSTDEAFMSKESSQEELESDINTAIVESPRDSEGSSGVHEEDSENEWPISYMKKYSHDGSNTNYPSDSGRTSILQRSHSTKVPSLTETILGPCNKFPTVEDLPQVSSLRNEAGDLHMPDDKGLHIPSRFQKAKKQFKILMGVGKNKPEFSGSDTSLYGGPPQNSLSHKDFSKSSFAHLSSGSIAGPCTAAPQVPERKFSQPVQSSWSRNTQPYQPDLDLMRQSSEPPASIRLCPSLPSPNIAFRFEHSPSRHQDSSPPSRVESWESTINSEYAPRWLDKHQTVSFPVSDSPSVSEAIELAVVRKNKQVSMAPDVSVHWDEPKRSGSFSVSSATTFQHNLVKTTKFYRGEICIICKKMMTSFFTHGFRCNSCHNCFHPKCDPSQIICDKEFSHPRRKRKTNKNSKKWNLNRTSEFTDREDQVIADVTELRALDDLLSTKIFAINNDKKETAVDKDFKSGLREFKANLIQTYSVASKSSEDTENLCIRYRDLITSFEQVMNSVCEHGDNKDHSAVTMGVNAFRGFLDEFVQSRMEDERPRVKKSKRERKKKRDEITMHLNHQFLLVILNIPTACEICSSFLWLMEKGLVCKNCKLTCHKKCYSKVTSDCSKDEIKENMSPEGAGGKLFGARLESLVADGIKIPSVVERLIVNIEINGLYTEGLYRKSGATSTVKQVIQLLEDDPDSVDFETYTVHVLTAVLKTFLREMPEPLMTFEAYDDFLRATDVQDQEERTSAIFSVIRKLPTPYFNLLERLMYHLARVSYYEAYNRMNPSSLAIVFAPCILKTNKFVKVQDTLNDIRRITMCVQSIIQEQCGKLRNTLADIDTLDSACHTATTRLTSLGLPDESNSEATILTQQIQDIREEKAHLTSVLPVLRRVNSDDDLLSTDLDSASNIGSLDDFPSLEEVSNSIDPKQVPNGKLSTQFLRRHSRHISPPHSAGILDQGLVFSFSSLPLSYAKPQRAQSLDYTVQRKLDNT